MTIPQVLVVDDDRFTRFILRSALKHAGYGVLDAATGAEAVDLARQGVDLALLDVKLPDANGFDLLRSLKAADPRLAVVMMTSHGSALGVSRAMEGGAYRYVTKPFDTQVMLEIVSEALMKRSASTVQATGPEPTPPVAPALGSPGPAASN